MRSYYCFQYLVASFFVLATLGQTNASPTIAAIAPKASVTYDVPVGFSAGDDLITKFKAVSSHGRSDEADEATAVTYTTFQVTTRAFYLLLVFAPMFWTSGLAFVSSWYRNGIWFRLLRFGISQGGAVRFPITSSFISVSAI